MGRLEESQARVFFFLGSEKPGGFGVDCGWER